ncbi:c-type cytochrome [Tritonibacter mobilis]|uniref:c-type cytochrome n=1 Tax=Tritonibacter mobilis TaxID=379347 RepID=UPI000E0DE57E|nr:cytochrome c [Tritonibacter mobilis]
MKYRIAAIVIALGGTAFAHTGVKNEDVLARMDGMSAIADAVKVIGTMAKGEAEFDAAAIDAALSEIETRAGNIPMRFETEVITEKSEALPVIWEDMNGFADKATALQTLARDNIGTVQSAGDLRPLMRDMAGACRACHADYRE